MTKALQKHSVGTETHQEQLGKLLIFKDKQARYRKTYIDWDNIERANPPKHPTKKTKYLSKAAENIIALVIQKLEKGERVILNHKYLSFITKCERRQNQRILQQLSEILEITYHNSVTYKGKKYRYSYEFCYKLQKQENTEVSGDSIGTFLSQQNAPLYIDKENKDIEYIDLQSNFSKNSKEELRKNNRSLETKAKVFRFNQYKILRKLSDFYPLSQEDCSVLQRSSGRGFNLNAMNQILLDMSKRMSNRLIPPTFKNKKRFLKYMTEAFKNEMRDPAKINNETFKINANLSPEERLEQEAEKYLTNLENSREVSPEMHLKKKLGSVLPKLKAVELLKSYKSLAIMGDTAKLKLYQAVDLSPSEHKIVLNQIKASHERFKEGIFIPIEKLELIITKPKPKNPKSNNIKQIPDTIWGNIRRSLIAYYYEDGIDTAWFSKLEATEDSCAKEINLTCSNNFIIDWSKNNYGSTIERIAETIGVKVKWRGLRW